jgi:hypothetical protein
MPKYIVGAESSLSVTSEEPLVLAPGKGGNVSKNTQALWRASSFVGRWAFSVKRGLVEEYKTWNYGNAPDERVFARVLPDDAAPALDAIDAKIVEHETEWKRLKKERVELLAAIAPRAERVRVKT